MSNEYFHEQLALMLMKGRSAEYIANRLKKTVTWVEEAARHPDVIERCTEMRGVELAERKEADLWDKERIGLEIQGDTPHMLAQARKIALSDTAADNNKLKAIELWLKYNEEMPQVRDADDGNQERGIYIDGPVAERLFELAQSRAQRQKLLDGSLDPEAYPQ